MELKFLERGSAFNIKEGNNSAYIKENNELVLIDCGSNIFERILNKNILDHVNKVSVLITHLHSNHTGSLSDLIYYCYYIKKIVIDIYFPTVQLHDLLMLEGHIEGEEYNFHILDEERNNSIDMANITNITPIRVTHKHTLNCFGYLLYINKDKLIWYSGDCNEIPDIVPNCGLDVDEFYQDTCLAEYDGNVHLSLSELCDCIPEVNRDKIYCMHIDCDELIDKAKLLVFNVIEVE